MDKPRDMTWAGPIALVLAAGVAVALAAAIIIIALDHKTDSTSLEAVLTTLAGAAVGAVGTYLGTTVRSRNSEPLQPHDETPPEEPHGSTAETEGYK